MNYFWDSNKEKFGIFNKSEFARRLGLGRIAFDKLMQLETASYLDGLKKRGIDYYKAKLEENPDIEKYGNTPLFPSHPLKNKHCIFNNKSGVYLEKKWSKNHKDNKGKDLPFSFIFNGE